MPWDSAFEGAQMDLGTISAGYASLKAAIETVRTVVGTRAQIAADARVIDALEQLGKAQEMFMDMRGAMYELQEENRLLKDRLREQQAWTDRASKYELVATAGGATIYRSNESPQHYACPACYEAKQIQMLQDGRNVAGTWRCPNCKASYPINPGRYD
jgi:predicted RNA-binding Zn-ribbon protein involved in translation (DUF1610 family)